MDSTGRIRSAVPCTISAGTSIRATSSRTGLTTLAARRGGVDFAHQLLFYPCTDSAFETGSYRDFVVGYALRVQGYRDFWDLYCPDADARLDATASPLRATRDELCALPPATVNTAEADCLRDEGEDANALRAAGVPVLATRYQGVTNGFVMLDAMRSTCAADAAIDQAASHSTPQSPPPTPAIGPDSGGR